MPNDEESDLSVYHQMASLVTVRQIQTPLGLEIDFEMTVADAELQMFEAGTEGGFNPVDRISLVVENGSPMGWTAIGYDGVEDPSTVKVGSVAEPIRPSQLITANTPYLDTLSYFAEEGFRFCFVLDGRRLTGTVDYAGLFKPPGRMCLFALTLELETNALRLCQRFAKQCFDVLSDGRKEKAIAVWKKRYESKRRYSHRPIDDPHDHLGEIVACTTFIDKARMISKCKLVIDRGRDEIDCVFNRAERIRNACAHPVEGESFQEVLERKNLGSFLVKLTGLIDSIRRQTPDD